MNINNLNNNENRNPGPPTQENLRGEEKYPVNNPEVNPVSDNNIEASRVEGKVEGKVEVEGRVGALGDVRDKVDSNPADNEPRDIRLADRTGNNNTVKVVNNSPDIKDFLKNSTSEASELVKIVSGAQEEEGESLEVNKE